MAQSKHVTFVFVTKNYQPIAGTSGKSTEEIIKDKLKEILDKLPPLFDVEKASIKHPVSYEESMNTVL